VSPFSFVNERPEPSIDLVWGPSRMVYPVVLVEDTVHEHALWEKLPRSRLSQPRVGNFSLIESNTNKAPPDVPEYVDTPFFETIVGADPWAIAQWCRHGRREPHPTPQSVE